MIGSSHRKTTTFDRSEGSSYFDYQEHRLVRVEDRERNAQDVLKDPATDSFVVQIADEETAEALQRQYFAALKSTKE